MGDSKIEWCEKVWNPVMNFPSYYSSEDGQILGPSGKIMKQMKMPSGHLYVLCNQGYGKQRKLFVHRAVLLAFIGLPTKGQETRHLDGNPTNNNLKNLKWGTRKEQREDERKHGTRCIGERSGTSKLTERQVLQIRKDRPSKTLRKLAKDYGVSHTTILAAITGRHWGHLNG